MGFWQDITGKSGAGAARAAAADTYRKQQAAVSDLKAYGDTIPEAYRGLADNFAPYAQAGGLGLAQLTAGLGLNGAGGTEAFTNAYRSLPGYTAGLQTGQNAVMGTASARGMLNSGRTMKDLQRFGSDYEDRRVGDYMTRLGGLAGMGQTATAQGVATEGQGLAGQLQTRLTGYGGQYGSAGTIGQGDIAAANAMAAGSGNLLNLGMNIGGKLLGAASGGMGGGMGMGGSSFMPSSSFMNNSWGW